MISPEHPRHRDIAEIFACHFRGVSLAGPSPMTMRELSEVEFLQPRTELSWLL